MPVRTSLVVAWGLALLTLIGVTTVFGESLLALVAPASAEGLAHPAPPAARPDGGAPNNGNGNP